MTQRLLDLARGRALAASRTSDLPMALVPPKLRNGRHPVRDLPGLEAVYHDAALLLGPGANAAQRLGLALGIAEQAGPEVRRALLAEPEVHRRLGLEGVFGSEELADVVADCAAARGLWAGGLRPPLPLTSSSYHYGLSQARALVSKLLEQRPPIATVDDLMAVYAEAVAHPFHRQTPIEDVSLLLAALETAPGAVHAQVLPALDNDGSSLGVLRSSAGRELFIAKGPHGADLVRRFAARREPFPRPTPVDVHAVTSHSPLTQLRDRARYFIAGGYIEGIHEALADKPDLKTTEGFAAACRRFERQVTRVLDAPRPWILATLLESVTDPGKAAAWALDYFGDGRHGRLGSQVIEHTPAETDELLAYFGSERHWNNRPSREAHPALYLDGEHLDAARADVDRFLTTGNLTPSRQQQPVVLASTQDVLRAFVELRNQNFRHGRRSDIALLAGLLERAGAVGEPVRRQLAQLTPGVTFSIGEPDQLIPLSVHSAACAQDIGDFVHGEGLWAPGAAAGGGSRWLWPSQLAGGRDANLSTPDLPTSFRRADEIIERVRQILRHRNSSTTSALAVAMAVVERAPAAVCLELRDSPALQEQLTQVLTAHRNGPPRDGELTQAIDQFLARAGAWQDFDEPPRRIYEDGNFTHDDRLRAWMTIDAVFGEEALPTTADDFVRALRRLEASEEGARSSRWALMLVLIERSPALRLTVLPGLYANSEQSGWILLSHGAVLHVHKSRRAHDAMTNFLAGAGPFAALGPAVSAPLASDVRQALRQRVAAFVRTRAVDSDSGVTDSPVPLSNAAEVAMAARLLTRQLRMSSPVSDTVVAQLLLDEVTDRGLARGLASTLAAGGTILAGNGVRPWVVDAALAEAADLWSFAAGEGVWTGIWDAVPSIAAEARFEGDVATAVRDLVGRLLAGRSLTTLAEVVSAFHDLVDRPGTRWCKDAWLLIALAERSTLRAGIAEAIGQGLGLRRPFLAGGLQLMPRLSAEGRQDLRDFAATAGFFAGDAPRPADCDVSLAETFPAHEQYLTALAGRLDERSLVDDVPLHRRLTQLAEHTRLQVGGCDGAQLAGALLEHIGGGTQMNGFGRCYSRTATAIFAGSFPAEYVRIVGELATTGETRLASGLLVRWQMESRPDLSATQLVGLIWGYLVNCLRAKQLSAPMRITPEREVASRGEMANVMTRLLGERFVNVDLRTNDVNDPCVAIVRGLYEAEGVPFLAEYQDHGGSFAGTDASGFRSLELGGTYTSRPAIGYVVLPERLVRAAGLTAVDLANDSLGYLDPSSLSLR